MLPLDFSYSRRVGVRDSILNRRGWRYCWVRVWDARDKTISVEIAFSWNITDDGAGVRLTALFKKGEIEFSA